MRLRVLYENNQLFDAVRQRIMGGNSMVKRGIESGAFNISDIIQAIEQNRCLRMTDRDVGATYLEQIIGGAIRDAIPVKKINAARKLFSLEPLEHDELILTARKRKHAQQKPK